MTSRAPATVNESTARADLIELFRPHRGAVILMSALLLLSTSIPLAFPQAVRFAIDWGLRGGTRSELVAVAAGLSVLLIARGVLRWYWTVLALELGARVVARLRVRVVERVVQLPMEWHAKNPAGELTGRLAADGAKLGMLAANLTTILGQIVFVVLGVVMMFVTDVVLTAWSLLIVPLLLISLRAVGSKLQKRGRAAVDEEARASSFASTIIGASTTVQSFNQVSAVVGRYRDRTERAVLAYRTLGAWQGAVNALLEASSSVAVVVVVWLGGIAVASGRLSAGDVTAFLIYLFLVTNSLSSFGELWSITQQAIGATERLFAITRERIAIRDPRDPRSIPDQGEGLRIRDLTITYADRPLEPALRNITLALEPGRPVALVGRSGAGKSTLAAAIQRWIDPTFGSVTLHGVDLREASLAEVRKRIVSVPQDPVLLPGSVAECIAFGDPSASRDRIIDAAKRAHVDHFITGLPDGYDTVLSDRGANLSGGQRQRIALARALMLDPDVLILDEVSSQQDAESEAAIHAAIAAFVETRCALIIAHRFKTIEEMPLIAVIESGQCVQLGSHAELMREGGLYRHLAELQMADAQLEDEVTMLHSRAEPI